MCTRHTPEAARVRGYQGAADFLRVSLATAKRLARAGALKGVRITPRRIEFSRADLQRVAAARAKEGVGAV